MRTRHAEPPARSLVPLVVDVGIPAGSYYLLHAGLGLSLWLSLALSSVVPAVRSVTGLVARRELNVLALLNAPRLTPQKLALVPPNPYPWIPAELAGHE